MKIIEFPTITWEKIPKDENPANDYMENEHGITVRSTPCLVICNVFSVRKNCFENAHYAVMEVPKLGKVKTRGMFDEYDYARFFAQELRNKIINK